MIEVNRARAFAGLREAVHAALGTVRPESPVRRLDALLAGVPRPGAVTAILQFPRWAEELCGRRLPRGEREALELAQAYLLVFILLRDPIADGEPGAGADVPDLLPLLFEAQVRLGAVFGPRDRFWSDFRRLVAEQVEADRWERAAEWPRELDDALVRRLGLKAGLLRWPAAAVARRVGLPRAAPRIERAFADLLEVFQLVDDVADAAKDAAAGQVNAVLAAAGVPAHASEALLQIADGIPRAFAAVRARLGRLDRARGGIGAFSRSLRGVCDRTERVAIAAANRRGAVDFLSRLVQSP